MTFLHKPHPKQLNYMGYGEFTLHEHRIRAWQPANDAAPREFIVEVEKDGELVRLDLVPMFHPNHLGVDVEDAYALDEKIETIIAEMKLE